MKSNFKKMFSSFIAAVILITASFTLSACSLGDDNQITEEQAAEIVEELMERRIYLYYTVIQCNFERDRDSAIEENGTQYVPIIDSDCPFTCVEDIRGYVSDTFTEGFIENSQYPELLDGDMPRYINHDGKLYALNGDGGGNEVWAYGNMELQIEEDKISADFEGLDCYDSPISAQVVLTKAENVWKIDQCAVTSEFGTETNK